jgi:integrase/recombinase XerD
VTKSLQRLHDELVRRDYPTTTRESYLKILKAFHRHVGKRLDHVGPHDLRRYQVHLLEERRLAVGTDMEQLAALRFFYLRVLKGREMKEDLPYPKRPRRLPIILSPEEVQRLIAGAQNLFHRTMLMTLYGGGLRRSELLHLKVVDACRVTRAEAPPITLTTREDLSQSPSTTLSPPRCASSEAA